MPEPIHDKGYKRILAKKKNFLSLLRDFVAEPWVQDLKEEDLQLIDKEFIAVDFKEKEADIIYQVTYKDREIVFYCLMELQSGVDHTMPFRLLVYMVELLKRIFDDTAQEIRERADYKLPAVIPIVLYNGSAEWTAVRSFKEYMAGSEIAGNRVIDYRYILLDVNRYSAENLFEISSLISSVFALDKKQNLESIKRTLSLVVRQFSKLNLDEQLDLTEWMADVLLKKAKTREIVSEAIEYLEKGEETMMTYAIERLFDEIEEKGMQKGIEKGIEEGMEKGIEEGMEKAALKMLQKNMPLESIQEVTDLSIEQIQALKEKLERM